MPSRSSRHSRHVSAKVKSDTVLRVLKGERADAVADEIGIAIDRIDRWKNTFISGGVAALEEKSRQKTAYDRLRSAFHGLSHWVLLFLALAGTVYFLARFLYRSSGE